VSIRERLIQGTRAFVRSATGLSSAAVVVAQQTGPRPALPYLTVEVVTPGVQVGEDELFYDLGGAGGTMREWVRGQRRATVQVSGYGTDAPELLEQVRLSLGSPVTRAPAETTYGISLAGVVSQQDLTALRETDYEIAALLELAIHYRTESAPVASPEASRIDLLVTLDGVDPPADLVAGVALVGFTLWDLGSTTWDGAGSVWDEGVVL
jgi:hypothetical protein